MFTRENTRGYTETERRALNREWLEIVEAEQLDPDTDEYYAREKQFQDNVSRCEHSRAEAQRNTDAIRQAGLESGNPHPFRVEYEENCQPPAFPPRIACEHNPTPRPSDD